MNKYIIREVPSELSDFSTYFDDDGLTERGGDYNYNLFIVQNEGYGRLSGFNLEEYKNIQSRAGAIIEGFEDVRDGVTNYDGDKVTYKDIMQEHGIRYSPRTCHRLKVWSEDADIDETADIADFLTIITGEYWKASAARGYCQGDYCEVIACAKHYTNPIIYGEVWLGAATEYSITELDDDGNELDTVYGYIVAESEAWTEERTKELVCKWEGIDPSEATLELIDGQTTRTEYNYRTA